MAMSDGSSVNADDQEAKTYEYFENLKDRGNRWVMDLVLSRRDAARWNLLAGGVVLTVSGSAFQLADGASARLIAAVGIVLALTAFVRVVLDWRIITIPREAEREAAPWMMGIERDMLPPLRSQTRWLAIEFIVLAFTLAAALVASVFSENDGEANEGDTSSALVTEVNSHA